ncbi:MAG: phosphatase PAP2 family protein [Aureliella sp.]
MAALLCCAHASAQRLSPESFERPASASGEDWLAQAGYPASYQRPLRLEQWADTLSADAAHLSQPTSRDIELLTLAGHDGHSDVSVPAYGETFDAITEESPGLEELRAELDRRPASASTRAHRLFDRLKSDQLNFYSPESLFMLGSGLAVGGLMANTSLDRNIQRHLQSSLHHANTDEWLESLHANKEFGDGRLTLPIFGAAWIGGSLLPDGRASDAVSRWGEKSLRGFLVGAPPVLALQYATGGSRPGETLHGSEWQPFQDDNGVSGHSFMGALPFITAAKMTDAPGWKAAFYAASTLAPLSRTADGAHYPSQIALGWWMAYLSASAVHATDHPDARWRIFPTTVANGSGMALEYRF